MEFLGTKFSFTIGGVRLRFALALEEVTDDEPARRVPHHVYVSPEGEPARRAAGS